MIKTDPIIAVANVEESSKWYQSLLGCKNIHEGNNFAVLADEKDDVILCLHKWGEHEHPTMKNQGIVSDNGLILYFRTDKMELICENAKTLNCIIEKEIHLNINSNHKEFSLRDLDGYYLTFSEYHNY